MNSTSEAGLNGQPMSQVLDNHTESTTWVDRCGLGDFGELAVESNADTAPQSGFWTSRKERATQSARLTPEDGQRLPLGIAGAVRKQVGFTVRASLVNLNTVDARLAQSGLDDGR